MQFMPSGDRRLRYTSVLTDVLSGKVASLLHFIAREDREAGEGEALWESLLNHRTQLDWLFSREDLEPLLLNRRAAGNHYPTLQTYFVFARKLGPADSEGYYIREQEILWGRFFGDLGLLGVNITDPLYINLKNYLDWSRYQPELNSARMIAKIFWPFYLKLKSQAEIPPALLREGLKIALHLNPAHAPARLERTEFLIQSSQKELAFQELREALNLNGEHPILDGSLLSGYFELSADLEKSSLLEDASRLFGCGGVSLKSEYWMDLALRLLHAGDPIGALFHHLKGWSYDTSRISRMPELRRILCLLGQWQLAEDVLAFHQAHQPEAVVQIPSDLLGKIQIRTLTDKQFKSAQHHLFFCGSGPQEGLEVRYPESGAGDILFARGGGFFDLSSQKGQFSLQPMTPDTKQPSQTTLRYAGFELSLKPGSLKSITPFHFTTRNGVSSQ